MNTAERTGLPPLVESSHGTVCPACRLWPDQCTCRPDHPMLEMLRSCGFAVGAPLAPRESPTPWTHVQTSILGFRSLYDARGSFIGTVVSPELADRIVSAINQQE